MDNILEELQLIFRDILDQPDLVLTRALNASNVTAGTRSRISNRWISIEKRYKIKFVWVSFKSLMTSVS